MLIYSNKSKESDGFEFHKKYISTRLKFYKISKDGIYNRKGDMCSPKSC